MSLLNKILKKKEEDKKDAVEKKSEKKTTSSGAKQTAKSAVEQKEQKKAPVQKGEVTPAKAQASRIIVKPLVTEKAAHAQSEGVYTFVINNRANKVQVAQAVQALYGVYPTAVRIINTKGKVKRFGRSMGKRSDWKKALVTLPKGKQIQVHEGV